MGAFKKPVVFGGVQVWLDRNDEGEAYAYFFEAKCWVFIHEVNEAGEEIENFGGLWVSSMERDKRFFAFPTLKPFEFFCVATGEVVDIRDKEAFAADAPGAPELDGGDEDVVDLEEEPVVVPDVVDKVPGSARRINLGQPWEAHGDTGITDKSRFSVMWGVPWDFGFSHYNGELRIHRAGDFDRCRALYPNAIAFIEGRQYSAPDGSLPSELFASGKDDWNMRYINRGSWLYRPFLVRFAESVAGIPGAHLYYDWGFRGIASDLIAAANRFRELRPDGVVMLNINDSWNDWYGEVADAFDMEVPHDKNGDGSWDLDRHDLDAQYLAKWDAIIKDRVGRARRPDLCLVRVVTRHMETAVALEKRWGGMVNVSFEDPTVSPVRYFQPV